MSYWFSKLQLFIKKASGSTLLNNKYFTDLILPILFVIVVTLVYGSVYYEENDDFFLSILLKGDLQPQGGFREISSWGYKYLLHGYSFLYSHLPGIPWYGIALYVLNTVTSINIFYVLNRSLSKHFDKLACLVFSLLILFIVDIENIILINFTRTAILLAGSSLLVLLIRLTESKRSPDKEHIILYGVLFSTAFFIRPVTALMISLLTLPFILYIGLRSNRRRHTFYFVGFLLLIVSLFYFMSNSFRPDYEEDMIKYYEPIANIMDFGHENPEQLLSKQDSLKREAIGYFFIADKTQITHEYVSRITSSTYISYDKLDLPRLLASIRHIALYLFKDYLGITLLYMLLMIAFVYSGYRKHKIDLTFTLLMQLAFFSFLMIVNTLTKLPERLFVPLYCMIFVSNIYLLRYSEVKFKIKQNTKLLSVFLILSFSLAVYCFSGNYRGVRNQSGENYETFLTLEKQYTNTTFLITLQSSFILGSLRPLKSLPLGSNKLLPINGYTTIMPSYYKELESICGSTNINDFFNYIKGRHDYLLISDDKFNEFLSRYFHSLYNNEMSFVLVTSTPDILKHRKLFLYRITQ